MLLTADKSKKAIIAYIAHFFVMFIIISIFTYISTCIMGARQKKRIITGIIMFLIIYALTIAFLLCIFYLPVDYNDDFYKNDNYWDLSTGSRIAYQKYGDNSSDYYPIISLHGGPGIPPNGKDLFGPDLASEGFVVYHYDQFGCGNSNRAKDPKEYTIERQVKDLEEIRKKIGVKKINLIGNSWGGTLAANYMAKYNENVNNTIFISPGPIWLGDNSYEQYKKEALEDFNNAIESNFRFHIISEITYFKYSEGLFYLIPEKNIDKLMMKTINFHGKLDKERRGSNYTNSAPAGYGFWVSQLTQLSSVKEKFNYEDLDNSHTKCLIFKGEKDYLTWDTTILYRKKINDSTLILIDEMGHTVEEEKYRKIVSQNIIYFLRNGSTLREPYVELKDPWK